MNGLQRGITALVSLVSIAAIAIIGIFIFTSKWSLVDMGELQKEIRLLKYQAVNRGFAEYNVVMDDNLVPQTTFRWTSSASINDKTFPSYLADKTNSSDRMFISSNYIKEKLQLKAICVRDGLDWALHKINDYYYYRDTGEDKMPFSSNMMNISVGMRKVVIVKMPENNQFPEIIITPFHLEVALRDYKLGERKDWWTTKVLTHISKIWDESNLPKDIK
jgi:hypothetical protein